MNLNTHNKVPPTVQAFRSAGYKTSVRHLRPVIHAELKKFFRYLPQKAIEKELNRRLVDIGTIRSQKLQGDIYPRGGVTIVTIEKDGKVFEAKSTCSVQDTFCRTFGIEKCMWKIYGQIVKDAGK